MSRLKTIVIPDHAEKAKQRNAKKGLSGRVRVGRIKRRFETGKKFPYTKGYINIIVMSCNKTKLGSQLSPYVLKDKKGRNMENIWQFAKLYKYTPKVYDKCGWKYLETQFCKSKKDKPNKDYWKWRKEGMYFKNPVRYPVGFKHRHECIGLLWPKDGNYKNICNPDVEMVNYDYVTARKKVYNKLYMDMAKETDDFKVLRKLLKKGYNIQLLDVDGPEKRFDEYGDAGEPYNQMVDGEYGESGVGTIRINKSNIKKILNNTSQPMGHGYALAAALLKKEHWIL